MNAFKRGALIVIEGVDRSGKSTQSKKLVESLRNAGYKSELMVFPDRSTHTGRLISEYLSNKNCKLNDQAIHLLFSANRWENVDKMKQLLSDGVNLIIDRYSYSGVAFSSAKNMDMEWCKQPEIGLPKPDLVFLLTLTDEEMQTRPNFGQERYENLKMQTKVKKMYKKLYDENWNVINANGTIDQVHDLLLNSTINTIKNVENTSLKHINFI